MGTSRVASATIFSSHAVGIGERVLGLVQVVPVDVLRGIVQDDDLGGNGLRLRRRIGDRSMPSSRSTVSIFSSAMAITLLAG